MNASHLNLSKSISTEIAGENALIVYYNLADEQAENLSEVIAAFSKKIAEQCADAVKDIIPAYQSILITFDLFKVSHLTMSKQVFELATSVELKKVKSGKEVILPVYYHQSVGSDLPRIAHYSKLSIEEVIERHQNKTYTVQAVGFAPGFPYLGDVDPKIATPRLETPRIKVPRGAVAIANNQTAIYPQISPGGWNIIGLCPTTLFDPNAKQPLLLNVGDTVKFTAIDQQGFLALGGTLERDVLESL